MANFILCYNTGSGVINRVVNGDALAWDSCKASMGENKVSCSTDSSSAFFLGSKRFSGSISDMCNGVGLTLANIDLAKWYVNGQQISSSMDVSIPGDTSFNLGFEILNGDSNEKVSLSGDGLDLTSITYIPRWSITSAIMPDDEGDLYAHNSVTASLRYEPFTNGEATRSVNLSSDSNRVYLFRSNAVACNLIKD